MPIHNPHDSQSDLLSSLAGGRIPVTAAFLEQGCAIAAKWCGPRTFWLARKRAKSHSVKPRLIVRPQIRWVSTEMGFGLESLIEG